MQEILINWKLDQSQHLCKDGVTSYRFTEFKRFNTTASSFFKTFSRNTVYIDASNDFPLFLLFWVIKSIYSGICVCRTYAHVVILLGWLSCCNMPVTDLQSRTVQSEASILLSPALNQGCRNIQLHLGCRAADRYCSIILFK